MIYRELGNTGIKFSEIGMGCEGFLEKTPEECKEYIDRMEQYGINCIDMYTCRGGTYFCSVYSLCSHKTRRFYRNVWWKKPE